MPVGFWGFYIDLLNVNMSEHSYQNNFPTLFFRKERNFNEILC